MKTNSSSPKGKEKSDKAGSFAKGGSTHMFGKRGVQTSEAGKVTTGPGGFDSSFKAKAGGKGVMGKQRGAAPATPGGHSSGGRGGDNTFKASGGSGHMAGYTGAMNAKPR